jgi:hypothetical protein
VVKGGGVDVTGAGRGEEAAGEHGESPSLVLDN